MSSTQGNLVLVLMGATAAAPWAALALESRAVREKLARRKARRTVRGAGLRTVQGRTSPSITRDAMVVPSFPLNWDATITPGSASTRNPLFATVTPIVAPAAEVFVSVGAVISLPGEPPELAA
ncbi:hypothetical protein [Saccharopolyspora gloriosae]|uniref:hypothetical protein n=1 Tax=Saccharopolyspora gloriosae TaxID=455344 RepID=UPI001FB6D0C9|nr:hypothetical protein [Saccharopolyspora gloriosae]